MEKITGYTWECPQCGNTCESTENLEFVTCDECGCTFEGNPEMFGAENSQ
jgi:hypothetical protein